MLDKKTPMKNTKIVATIRQVVLVLLTMSQAVISPKIEPTVPGANLENPNPKRVVITIANR